MMTRSKKQHDNADAADTEPEQSTSPVFSIDDLCKSSGFLDRIGRSRAKGSRCCYGAIASYLQTEIVE